MPLEGISVDHGTPSLPTVISNGLEHRVVVSSKQKHSLQQVGECEKTENSYAAPWRVLRSVHLPASCAESPKDGALGVISHGECAFSDKAAPVRNALPMMPLVTSIKTH